MAGASIHVDGAEETIQELSTIAAHSEHPHLMWDAIGASLVVSTQHRFEEGRAPDGTLWPPSYRAILTGGKTLVDTARLMTSITHEASENGVAVGTNVLYAAIHQLGGVITPKAKPKLAFKLADGRQVFADKVTIPARPFLGLDDEDETEILAIAGEFVAPGAVNDGARP